MPSFIRSLVSFRHMVPSLIVMVAMAQCARTEAVTETTLRDLLERGRYDQAEMLARTEAERLSRLHGPDSSQVLVWSDLLLEAGLLNGKRALPDTLELAERVVAKKNALPPKERCCVARSLINLADALVGAAEYERASDTLKDVVSQLSLQAPMNSAQLAEALDHLATALILSDRNDEAVQTIRRRLELEGDSSTGGRLNVVRSLLTLGWALQRQSRYSDAATPIRRAVAIAETVNTKHPVYAEALSLFGLQLWFEGRLEEATATSRRALEIAELTLRPDHPTVALAVRRLGANVASLGDLTEAQALRQRALTMAERSFGSLHYETWAYLNDLADSNLALGDYVAARDLFERSLKIAESRFGAWHDSVATAVHNLAIVDASLGDYAKARREQVRATSIWERVLGKDHAFVAVSLTELAGVYRSQGAPTEALPLLQRALSIRERSSGPNHVDVARTLTDLASTFSRMGQTARAQDLAARSLSIWESSNAPGAPDFANALSLYGELQLKSKDPATARTYFERALAIRAKGVGQSHPAYADTQINLAVALASLGDVDSAVRIARAGEETGREHLRLMVRSLPERESLNYAVTRPKALDLMLSLVGTVPTAVPSAVDALIRSRALVLDEMVARVRPAASGPAELADLRKKLLAAQQRLASLVVRGPQDQTAEQYSTLLAEARSAKEETERILAERSARFRAELSYERAGLDDIRRALPQGSVLLSFVRYGRSTFPSAGRSATSAPAGADVASYLAFLISQHGEPVAVPLGEASTIDDMVARWRSDVSADSIRRLADGRRPSAVRTSGTQLRHAIWDPVFSHVDGATTLFVVPDDALSLVPFAALPGTREEFVLEEAPVIHYLTAERDLLRVEEEPRETARSLLAVGGPAFDDASTLTASRIGAGEADQDAPALRAVQSHCDTFQSLQFAPLAGTVQEVEDVARLWRAPGRALAARVLVSNEATERLFKEQAPKHQVIHLATHGFFLGASCPSTTAGLRAVGGLVSASGRKPQRLPEAVADSPLLLSGVALAGANRRASAGGSEEDGILTAEEVSGLDLSGVRWAVLSACNTGVGEVRAGEGVFGLRRAFQIAGARTVIMSLWSVDDEATRVWMHALYDGRLNRRLGTAEAVRQASLSVLRDRRSAGLSTHPFYWAAFVAAGDWR